MFLNIDSLINTNIKLAAHYKQKVGKWYNTYKGLFVTKLET